MSVATGLMSHPQKEMLFLRASKAVVPHPQNISAIEFIVIFCSVAYSNAFVAMKAGNFAGYE
jgi:hypothetical protein